MSTQGKTSLTSEEVKQKLKEAINNIFENKEGIYELGTTFFSNQSVIDMDKEGLIVKRIKNFHRADVFQDMNALELAVVSNLLTKEGRDLLTSDYNIEQGTFNTIKLVPARNLRIYAPNEGVFDESSTKLERLYNALGYLIEAILHEEGLTSSTTIE